MLLRSSPSFGDLGHQSTRMGQMCQSDAWQCKRLTTSSALLSDIALCQNQNTAAAIYTSTARALVSRN